MARSNDTVGAQLRELADLMVITGGDAFRARAYEKAARAVTGYQTDVSQLDAKGLQEIPGVGTSVAGKIAESLRTGTMTALEELRRRIPAGVRELVAIPAVGPKRAMMLYRELDIASVDQLVAAVREGRLRDLPGFGPKTEERILHGAGLLKEAAVRVPLDVAMELAEEITGSLSALPECERCAYAGSLRRMRDTVGDVDVLAAARRPGPLMAALATAPYVSEVMVQGPKKTSVRTASGLRVDLRVVPPSAWGAALLYFTGSKAHNIRVRELALRQGCTLSEYGLFHTDTGRRAAARTEEDVYARLGLPWIPPTLREDGGEIDAAARGELPELVTLSDLRGDLHTHTDLTDGVTSLEEMVRTAAHRGFAYYAVTDHAPDLPMQRMTDDKTLRQRSQVRSLDGRYGRMRLLHGTELNIGPDGGVDWPASFLAGFDVCVASVHSHFTQDQDALTRRLLRACENPHVHVIGHPTTRILGRRAGLDVDWDAVFEACARTGTALEINSQPRRLDLPDGLARRARRRGVRFAVDSDAHSARALTDLRYGVGVAQRAWLTGDDVINTWPWDRLSRFLRGPGDGP
ncbi:DNA polymerase/3'-5' exonuclease PolX [Streptomyces sp. B1866]|uniref:DNA polymerase/3'-5' exonuclease PolX n=1 Tax=Streptomyces sp. B1866 TaxID=3075431 RepID=UPI00288D2CEF|nr:DNA polymerase/3'-5' exonuclease PolX [Streptomyces sp. B1866]MDT3398198.1 DNA polymerase/3'-5' exonuclease PolX [Streptomyces sp. B1866]